MIASDAEILNDNARIWIYQADRVLNDQEIDCISKKLEKWQQEWNTHGKPLSNAAWIEDKLFLILAVDESKQPASGCSIDSSVHFIRQLGDRLNINFFERLNFVYQDSDGEMQITTDKELKRLYTKGIVDDHTLFYDTTLSTLGAWKEDKLVPLKDSWHKRFL